ncbi:MAG: kinase [Candidatus Marinimicrobia bacterium]|nr:kinase [Candidatus Neomarinimicrobiota bacterium]
MKKFDFIKSDQKNKCFETTSKLAHSIGVENISKQYFYEILLSLASKIRNAKGNNNKSVIIGLSGGQGTGKSTISTLIDHILNHYLDIKVMTLSIDNFYFSKEIRMEMAHEIHPLCRTRGVPGTHDTCLLKEKIDSLSNADSNTKTIIPVFSKIFDNYEPKENWNIFFGRPDIILLEGWCIGAKAIEDNEWYPPINSLEKKFDPKSEWAKWSNTALKNEYQDIFETIDMLIMIKESSIENIYQNRWKQEKTLKKLNKSTKIMSKSSVNEFVMHFERLTLHMLNTMPDYADVVIKKDLNYNYYINW